MLPYFSFWSLFGYPIAVLVIAVGFKLGLSTYRKALAMGPWNLYCYIDPTPELDNLKPVQEPNDIFLDNLIPKDPK